MAVAWVPDSPEYTSRPEAATELAEVRRLIIPGQLEPMRTYSNEVEPDSYKSIKPTIHTGIGTTYLGELTMDDGVRRQILRCEPSYRSTDVLTVKNTAWFTQVEGFNEDVGRFFMRHHLPLAIIGPEIGGSVPLSRSAHDTFQIFRYLTESGQHPDDMLMYEGFSRGAMIGFGILAYAEEFDTKVLYSNLTDPCLAEPVKVSLEQLKRLAENGPKELLTAGKQIGRLLLSPRRAWNYRRTIDASPGGIKQIIQTGKPLFNGETGKMAHHTPTDTDATINFFLNSVANDQAIFKRILRNHPGVRFNDAEGGHLKDLDKEILGIMAGCFLGLTVQFQDGVPPEKIDFSQVHPSTAYSFAS